MRSILIAILAGGVAILSISSCATVPTEPLTSGELRLLSIDVSTLKEDIKENFPFVVNIHFEANGEPEIRTACFSFSGDGPYCYKVTDVDYGSSGTIKVQVLAKRSGSYALQCYVYYIKDAKVYLTDVVGSNIRINP
jgi:hypothetical protein